MKRKLKWLAIVFAVSLLGFGMALLLWPRDRITEESYQRIRIGMVQKEVEGMLGMPRIHVKDFWFGYWLPLKKKGVHLAGWEWLEQGEPVEDDATYWIGGNGLMGIEFDNDGRVVGKKFHRVESSQQTFLDRLRDWLGW
jgi:hypothetical protein